MIMHGATAGLIVAFGLLSGSGAQAQSFHGYPCEGDCSSNQAGYDWAEQNGVTDPSSCGGDSQGFVDGCQAWAEEQGDDAAVPPDDEGDDLGDAPDVGPAPGDEADQPPEADDGEAVPDDEPEDTPEIYQEPDESAPQLDVPGAPQDDMSGDDESDQ
jgi:hypothetical protein